MLLNVELLSLKVYINNPLGLRDFFESKPL